MEDILLCGLIWLENEKFKYKGYKLYRHDFGRHFFTYRFCFLVTKNSLLKFLINSNVFSLVRSKYLRVWRRATAIESSLIHSTQIKHNLINNRIFSVVVHTFVLLSDIIIWCVYVDAIQHDTPDMLSHTSTYSKLFPLPFNYQGKYCQQLLVLLS